MEIAEELSPDPFSEEPRTNAHTERQGKKPAAKAVVRGKRKSRENSGNSRKTEENKS